VGSGAAVPRGRLSNGALEGLVDTDDEWISQRTGIRERRVADGALEGESASNLAAAAGARALDMAGVAPGEVDLVILATSTADDAFGGAVGVAHRLGAKNACGFDVTAACSGFVVGSVTAAQFIRAGSARNVLVIGGDVMSRLVDWRDRNTCILFGDGFGAMLMQAEDADGGAGGGGSGARGGNFLGHSMHSDGEGYKNLKCEVEPLAGQKPFLADEAASAPSVVRNVSMSGQEVFKFAVRKVPAVLEEAVAASGLEVSDVDCFVLHQANQRILDSVAQRLGVSEEKVLSNIANYGNTSAGSIPIALDEAVRSGRIKTGDTVAMAGFGAGLTWAAAVFRWG